MVAADFVAKGQLPLVGRIGCFLWWFDGVKLRAFFTSDLRVLGKL